MLKRTHYTETPSAKLINRELIILDAKDQKLGRLATQAASHLIGKFKTNFVNNIDMGDYVVVINVAALDIDEKKLNSKEYNRYSGYQGGQKKTLMIDMQKKNPTEPLKLAIKGMLPANKLKTDRLKRLYLFAKSEFQLPKEIQKLAKNNE